MGSQFDSWPIGPETTTSGGAPGPSQVESTWVQLAANGAVPEDEAVAEDEIGDILVKVQQFADETADEAERESQHIIDAARTEASRLVDEASERAHSIMQSAQQLADQIVDTARHSEPPVAPSHQGPPISREAITDLSKAISEFSATNQDLISELVQLRDSLTASLPAPIQPAANLSHVLRDLPR
jgi:cell division septum initiation protein DivIVA